MYLFLSAINFLQETPKTLVNIYFQAQGDVEYGDYDDHTNHRIDEYKDTSVVELNPKDQNVILTAKLALEEYERENNKTNLHFDEVIEAGLKLANGWHLELIFKAHSELNLFPDYKCVAVGYGKKLRRIEIQKVECKQCFYSC